MERDKVVFYLHICSVTCYLDELITNLRKLDIGCHIAGVWFGACAYADDIVLLSNNRDTLQKMVNVCQQYGADHNLTFSTDPDPKKSKTKCVLFTSENRKSYPVNISLDGKQLPWVDRIEHLGHILQQNGSAFVQISEDRRVPRI